MKTELEYKKNTLFVRVYGYASMEEIHRLKQKMYVIMNEYGITQISFNLKNAYNIDFDTFHEFLPLCNLIDEIEVINK